MFNSIYCLQANCVYDKTKYKTKLLVGLPKRCILGNGFTVYDYR